MVVQTDKGLGPGAIDPREYFRYATRDHIGDTRTYQRLSPGTAAYRATLVRKLLEKWIRTYLDVLSKEERQCICTHLRLNEEPWDFLYLLFKVHNILLKTSPVVSYCGNLLQPLGKLISEWLQPLANMHKFYFQDSFTLKKELDLKKIPSNTHLFICGATSLYTNIKTGPALHCIIQFALEHKEPMTVPPVVLLDEIRLLMTNNVFQFGEIYWLQKVVTAMGAPPAPPWATIFFGIHEETVLAQFGNKLQLYRCLINNVIGI